MARQSVAIPRLTPKERQTLELAIQGMSLDHMSMTLKQSPKVVERYIHQGLRKLESWSRDAAPGPNHNSIQERDLGFLRPRDAERRIARTIHDVGNMWACVVVLALPDNPKAPEVAEYTAMISRHIHQSTRRSDIVTKWTALEWIIFLAGVTPEQAQLVEQRLKRGHPAPMPLFIGSQYGDSDTPFNEVATQCHHELLAQYVHQDLTTWANPVANSL